ncbi:MAG: hypothetical protein KIT69_01840 [Propionibacteriaceae bacterium]|nr:hypothetical protein [Propionibacteriaceae bacterium]
MSNIVKIGYYKKDSVSNEIDIIEIDKELMEKSSVLVENIITYEYYVYDDNNTKLIKILPENEYHILLIDNNANKESLEQLIIWFNIIKKYNNTEQGETSISKFSNFILDDIDNINLTVSSNDTDYNKIKTEEKEFIDNLDVNTRELLIKLSHYLNIEDLFNSLSKYYADDIHNLLKKNNYELFFKKYS